MVTLNYGATFGNNKAYRKFWNDYIDQNLWLSGNSDPSKYLVHLNKVILDWMDTYEMEYSIAVTFRKISGQNPYGFLFDGFLLEFYNPADEMLFKLTWC
jgi:hypothetical protein